MVAVLKKWHRLKFNICTHCNAGGGVFKKNLAQDFSILYRAFFYAYSMDEADAYSISMYSSVCPLYIIYKYSANTMHYSGYMYIRT